MKKLLVSVIALFGAVSLSAQDVTAIYNEAAAAFGAKNFTEAAAKFEQVIDQGMDNESAASMVATAKSTLPKCYFMLGGGALKTKNYDEALKNFEKSAELAELYGDMNQMAKSNGWVAKIYQIQGGDAFNNKDYATASEIFAKGYAADPDNTGMALNLAMSYCEMAMSSGDMSQYEKGMEIYEAVAAKTHPKYAEDAAKAKEDMALYTNNMVAKMQAANDFDGIIKMADDLLAKNPQKRTGAKCPPAGLCQQEGLCQGHRIGTGCCRCTDRSGRQEPDVLPAGRRLQCQGDEAAGYRRLQAGDRRPGCRECQGCPGRTFQVRG